MKYEPRFRLLGLIFVILSSLGLFLSLSGIVVTWALRPRLQSTGQALLGSIEEIVITTEKSLQILDSSIVLSQDNLVIISSTLENLEETFDNISNSLFLSSSLIGDDLKLTVVDTQVAISSASSSAKLIDDTLAIIAAIPLLGARYQPDVPLNISLERVAGQMSGIPDALQNIEENMVETTANVNTLKSDISDLASNINEFDDDLEDAQVVIAEYLGTIQDLQSLINSTQNQINRYLMIMSFLISGIFILLGISQINIFMQGIIFLKGQQHVVNLADIQRK